MYTRVKQSEQEADVRGGISTIPERPIGHSGKRRCFVLSICLLILIGVTITAPVVVPALSSYFHSVTKNGASNLWNPSSQTEPDGSETAEGEESFNNENDEHEEMEHNEGTSSELTSTGAPTIPGAEKPPPVDQDYPEDQDDTDDDEESDTDVTDGAETDESSPPDLSDINVANATLMNDYLNRCTAWDDGLRQRFTQECPYWVAQFFEWESKLKPNAESVAYACSMQYECHGWGDRVAGMASAFNKALDLTRKFSIRHDHLKRVFKPCMFRRQATTWTELEYSKKPTDCIPTAFSCSFWNNRKSCPDGTWLAKEVDRTCLLQRHCEFIHRLKPDFSVVNLFGCGLRAMFEPSAKFLTTHLFAFRVNNEVKHLTLKAIHDLMSQYYVIGIHMRLGDGTAFSVSAMFDNFRKGYLMRPIRCASTLESFFTDGMKDGKIDGKEVRYLLASDSSYYKRMVWSEFGSKIMSFAFVPTHIAYGQGAANYRALSEEVGEWLTLGRADQLIINKIGKAINLYRGRVSGFSATSWIYQLKHMVYDASRCMRYSIPLDGIYSQNKGECQRSQLIRARYHIPQPHLDILNERNLTFPRVYVSDGKILKGDGEEIR